MTVTSTASSTTQQGNGATTSWPFAFPIPGATPTDQSNVKVFIVDQTVSPPTTTVLSNPQYSVTGISTVLNPSNAGTVTYPLSGAPLVAGQFITIQRNLPLTQLTSLPNQGPWQPKVVEAMVDYVTEILQGGILGISLALQNDPSDPAGAPATLPLTSLRKNQGAVWDANGNLIAGAVGSIPVNVAMTNLVQAVSVAAARTFLSSLLNDIAIAGWAQGDVMYFDGTHLNRLAAGTAGQMLQTSGAGANPSWAIAPVTAASFKNLKTTFNAVTPNTKWDATLDEIVVEDTNGNVMRLRGVSVTSDCGIVGANGIDAGALANNTFYFKWIIAKADGTTAALTSLSATAPAMPAGYTFKARIGAVRTDGAAHFWRVIQYGRRAQIIVDGTVLTAFPTMTSGASAQAAVAVANFVPTTAGRIILRLDVSAGTGGTTATVFANAQATSQIIAANNGGSTSNHSLYGDVVLESTNVYYSATVGAGGVAAMLCLGWEDNI